MSRGSTVRRARPGTDSAWVTVVPSSRWKRSVASAAPALGLRIASRVSKKAPVDPSAR